MCKLIYTDEHEVVILKALHGPQIKELDESLVCQGSGLFLLEVKDHAIQFLRVLTQVRTRILRPRRPIPTA